MACLLVLLLGIMLLYAVAVYCGGAVNPDSLSVVDVFLLLQCWCCVYAEAACVVDVCCC